MALDLRLPDAGIRPGRLAKLSSSGGLARRLARLRHAEVAAVGLLVVLTVGLLAIPLLAPHGPYDDVATALTEPGSGIPFGADEQGRDVLSRVLYGMRTSWFAALGVVASGIVIGGLVGVVAGMVGGWVDSLLMRITDLFLALPGPLLVLAVVSALGFGLRNTLLAVMITWWPFYARIVRGEVRSIAGRAHVEAARMGGIGRLRLAWSHVLPGTVGPVPSPPPSTSARSSSPWPPFRSSASVHRPPRPSSGP